MSASGGWATRAGRRLRALSLPCAGGEEPYSIAITLRDAGLPAGRFRIDAVDVSARRLAVARRGVYSANAFRGSRARAAGTQLLPRACPGLRGSTRRSARRSGSSRPTCSTRPARGLAPLRRGVLPQPVDLSRRPGPRPACSATLDRLLRPTGCSSSATPTGSTRPASRRDSRRSASRDASPIQGRGEAGARSPARPPTRASGRRPRAECDQTTGSAPSSGWSCRSLQDAAARSRQRPPSEPSRQAGRAPLPTAPCAFAPGAGRRAGQPGPARRGDRRVRAAHSPQGSRRPRRII